MRVKIEFLRHTANPPEVIEDDVGELSIEFVRIIETGNIHDVGVRLNETTYFGVHRITLILEEKAG